MEYEGLEVSKRRGKVEAGDPSTAEDEGSKFRGAFSTPMALC